MKMMLLGFTAVAMLGCKSNPPPEPPATPAAVSAPVSTNDPPPIAVGTKTKCAVTGEEFTVGPKTTQIVYQGKRYAFCCGDCLPEFNKNPFKYAKN